MRKFLQLWKRRLAASWNQSDPGLTSCAHCWRGYRFTKMHMTPYHACSLADMRAANKQYNRPEDFEGDECAGVNVLCEDCWRELTVEERLPYYEEVMSVWREQGSSEADIKKVMRAAEAGR